MNEIEIVMLGTTEMDDRKDTAKQRAGQLFLE
jgi:hypothetical protein